MEGRFNDQEKLVLATVFDTPEKIKLMRKVFLPEITQDAPIAGNESLMRMRLDGLSTDEIAIEAKTAMRLISHIEGALSMVQNVVSNKAESPAEIAQKIRKDSLK